MLELIVLYYRMVYLSNGVACGLITLVNILDRMNMAGELIDPTGGDTMEDMSKSDLGKIEYR